MLEKTLAHCNAVGRSAALRGARALTPGCFLIVVLAMVVVSGRNLASPNFWFDEAGQYWISVGQLHGSPLGTPDASIVSRWDASKCCNSDPGGYSFLMRAAISLLGSEPPYLRICSFIFFVLGVFGVFLLCRAAELGTLPSLAIATIPFIPDRVLEFAFETRAYSSESCGIVFLIFSTYLLVISPSRSRFALWLVVVAIFSWTRYGFVIFVIASLVTLLLTSLYYKSPSLMATFLLTLAYSFWLALIYVVHLRWISAPGLPYYMEDTVFKGKSLAEALEMLRTNFFAANMLPKTAFLLTGVACLAVDTVWRRRWTNRFIVVGLLLTMLCEAIYFVLSLIGLMPWLANSRWSFNENNLSLLGIIGIAVLITDISRGVLDRFAPRFGRPALGAVVAGLAISLVVYDSLRLARYDRANWEFTRVPDALWSMAESGEIKGPLVVQWSMWPSFRYIYERSRISIPKLDPQQIKQVEFEVQSLRSLVAAASPDTHFIVGTWDSKEMQKLKDVANVQAFGTGSLFTYVVQPLRPDR
jgi:hypothetical protein